MNLGNLQASLNLNIRDFSNAINQAVTQIRNMSNQMNNQMNNGQNGANNLNNRVQALTSSFKDLDRIVSGIMLSQAFYGFTNSVQNASSAIVQFSSNMEQAEIAMRYFLGSKEDAKEFIAVMQDFAATTPFSTEQALESSRRLMAMGFKPENVKPVLKIMTDAAAATGATAEQMNRVTLALGQMKTNGYIAGQELRQLAEAGIPVYKILQQELGLTADQLKSIGKMKISGDLGVAAVLKGMESRYKGAADEIANTMQGMWSTVKDDSLIASREIFEAPYNALKEFIGRVRDTMEVMRETMYASGIGGVFEKMVPPQLKQSLKLVAAGFIMIGQAIRNTWSALKPVAETLGTVLITGLGQILPVIGAVAKAVTAFAAAVIHASPVIRTFAAAIMALVVANVAAKALMFLWSVTRMGIICTAVAEAVMYLGRAIQFVAIVAAKSGLARVLLILTAVVSYLAYKTGVLSSMLDTLGAQIASFGGVDLDGLFVPENNKELDTMGDKWNQQLKEMSDNLKDVGSNASKAGKKVNDKFVAAFDELYQIPEKLDDVSDGLGDIGDMDLDPGLDMGAGIDGIGDQVKKGIESWFDPKWWDWLLVRLVPKEPPKGGDGGGGGSITPPPALPAPAVELSAVERMQKAYQDALNEIDLKIKAVQASIVALGETIFGWGSKAADVFGGITDSLEGFGTSLKNGLADIGNSIGDFVKGTGETIGNWGVNLGTVIVTLTEDAKARIKSWVEEGKGKIQDFIDGTAPVLTAWALGTQTTFNNWATNARTAFSTFVENARNTLRDWTTNTQTLLGGMTAATLATLASWGASANSTINNWVTNAKAGIAGMVTNTAQSLSTWSTGVIATLAALGTAATTSISSWVNNTKANIATWTTTVGTNVNTMVTSTTSRLKTWVTTTSGYIASWGTNVAGNIATAFEGTNDIINGWVTTTAKNLATWSVGTAGNIKAWVDNAGGNIVAFADGSLAVLHSWAKAVSSNFGNLFDGMGTVIYKWGSSALSSLAKWAQGVWDTVSDLASSIGQAIGSVFNGAKNMNPLTIPVAIGSLYTGIQSTFQKPGALDLAVTSIAAGGLGALKFVRPVMSGLLGLETGGIVDKEQIIRIGEGDRREAVIPLQNSTYMKPFSAAVASDLAEMMGSATPHTGTTGPPTVMYVGTLIADDRGLKELYRKMEVIQLTETQRKGLG